jgi:hypothetical protein
MSGDDAADYRNLLGDSDTLVGELRFIKFRLIKYFDTLVCLVDSTSRLPPFQGPASSSVSRSLSPSICSSVHRPSAVTVGSCNRCVRSVTPRLRSACPALSFLRIFTAASCLGNPDLPSVLSTWPLGLTVTVQAESGPATVSISSCRKSGATVEAIWRPARSNAGSDAICIQWPARCIRVAG